jgi:hypothetical protein
MSGAKAHEVSYGAAHIGHPIAQRNVNIRAVHFNPLHPKVSAANTHQIEAKGSGL